MEDKIKSAFDRVHADASLKSQTKEFVYNKTNGYSGRKNVKPRRIAAAAACAVIVLFGAGGYASYAYPVAAVSMDINPSVELEVNIYERVIDVKGYNDDGVALAHELDIKGMSYSDAVNSVLENGTVVSCLKSDGVFEVTVSSSSEKRMKNMENCIASETDIPSSDIYCLENSEDVATAHSLGLSLGKYRAFLELQQSYPDITAEEVKSLSMREIRNMINGDNSGNTSGSQNSSQGSGQGSGNGQGNAQGDGSGNGNKYQYGKNN